MIENINWYPGHMKKTRELIAENLKMVDLVIEVVDARIPQASRNPIIDELVKSKQRLIILNKSDLADAAENEKWAEYFIRGGSRSLAMNCNSGAGAAQLMKMLSGIQAKKNEGQLRQKPLRMMIVGVPNVGKSSLINRLTGKKSAKTGDRPGVTKGKQWLNLENNMQLLDTPGILWPKFEDPKAGLDLAFCGSIKDEILDVSELALELIDVLRKDYLGLLQQRYKLTAEDLSGFAGGSGDGFEDDAAGSSKDSDDGGCTEEFYNEDGEPVTPALVLMEAIARRRGFILPGKRIDYERCARTVLDEFRAGIIGRITLEKCEK